MKRLSLLRAGACAGLILYCAAFWTAAIAIARSLG